MSIKSKKKAREKRGINKKIVLLIIYISNSNERENF